MISVGYQHSCSMYAPCTVYEIISVCLHMRERERVGVIMRGRGTPYCTVT